VKHIEEKEYNWKYDRTNSKGKVIYRHDTNQTLEQVIFVLNNTYVPETLREEEERISFFLS